MYKYKISTSCNLVLKNHKKCNLCGSVSTPIKFLDNYNQRPFAKKETNTLFFILKENTTS